MKLNLFVQPDEPTVKEGLWIQAPEKHAVKQITTKDSFIVGGTWDTNLAVANPPMGSYSPVVNCHIAFGNKIFYFNLRQFADKKPAYHAVYDANTNTYRQFPTFNFVPSIAANIDGTIYLIDYYYSQIYIFDPVALTATLYGNYTGYGADGTNWVYFCGIFDSKIFFADLIDGHLNSDNGKYESQCNICAIDMSGSSTTKTCSLIHSKILTGNYQLYFIGCISGAKLYWCSTANSTSYPTDYSGPLNVLDLTTNTQSSLALPVTVKMYNNRSMQIGTYSDNLYLVNSSSTPLICYNITSNTFNRLPLHPKTGIYEYDIQFEIASGKMFMFCSFGDYTMVQNIYVLQSETLTNNSLAFLRGSKYTPSLITTNNIVSLSTAFEDAWWYSDDFNEYPTYIGTGTAFTKIKN